MKVSELESRSGVPLPTIKFYIRQGILPPGRHTAKNQADYSDEHLERLWLVRALRDDAGLSIATIAKAMKAADARKEGFVGAAIDALETPTGAAVDEASSEFKRALETVRHLAHTSGWELDRTNAALRSAARAWTVIQRSNSMDGTDFLRPYLEIAERIAEHEIPETWEPSAAPNATLRYAVLGTVLFEPLILAFRRMAHASRARKLESRTAARPTESRPSRIEKKRARGPGKRRPKRASGR